MQLTLFSSVVGSPLLLLLHFVLKPLMAEAIDSCLVEQHPHGTTYILKEGVEPCDNYNWLVDGIVKANEERFNSSMVHSRGLRNMTLLSCHENVSYRNSCSGTPKNCSTSCPTTLLPKEHASTDDGTRQPHSSANGGNLPALIGGSVAGVAVLCAVVVVVVVLCYKRDQLIRFFQTRRNAWCRCDYIAAPQVVVI